jgi:hypothetical protein
MRALIYLARGANDTAAAEALRAEERAREGKDPQMMLPALGVRLRVEIELGRVDEAATLASELVSGPAGHAACPPAIELAWAAERLGNADPVRAWVDRIAYPSLWTDAARAILDGELERAADLFVEIGSLPDEARARLRAGDADNVEKALAFYRSVGATRYIRQAEALLAASA